MLTIPITNMSSHNLIPRCRGSIISAARGFYGLISNTAGGYTFYEDARLRRLTRYRYNNVPLDMGGRYLYVRDNDNGSFGRRRGCRCAAGSMRTNAVTAWVTPSSPPQ